MSVCLSDVCLSIAYIGLKSRTERPRKTKIGTEVAHVTRDSDTIFKSEGQGHQAALLTAVLAHQLGGCSGGRGNVLAVENRYVAVCSAAEGASAPTYGGQGRGIPWRPPGYSLLYA